MYIYVVTRYLL